MKLYSFLAMILCANVIFAQCFEDRHNMNIEDSWKSCTPASNPATGESNHWIMYDLGASYNLYNMHLWNYNHPNDNDDGIASFTVHVSTNGSDWTEMGTEYSLPQASPSAFYEGQAVASLGGVEATHVLITAIDNYGGECFGLSEVRFGLEDCDNKIATDLILSPGIIGSESDIVLVTVVVLNTGLDALTEVDLVVDETLFSGDPYETSLQLNWQGDPNGNGILDPNEAWFYTGVKSYIYDDGDVFVVSAGVSAEAGCGPVVAGAGKLLFTVITDENSLTMDPDMEIEYRKSLAQLDDSIIYPSPALRGSRINIPLPFQTESELIIQNTSGQILRSQAVGAGSSYSYDTQGLGAGIYFASVKTGSAVKSYRFVLVD